MKEGIFKNTVGKIGSDNYGGNVFNIYINDYLVFVKKAVFGFSTQGFEVDFDDREQVITQLKQGFDLLNDKAFTNPNTVQVFEDNKLSFYLQDNFLNDRINFRGQFKDDHLYLKRYRESSPSEIMDEVYEYVGRPNQLVGFIP